MAGKQSAFPNAKKDQDFYLEIWRHSLCGFSNTEIAKGMGTSTPTVRRALNKIRTVEARPAFLILAETAQNSGVPGFLAYDQFIATMSKFYHGGQTVTFSDFFACLTKCDMRGSPRAFANKHIRLDGAQFERHALQFVNFLDIDAAVRDFDKFRNCRYCPLKDFKPWVMANFQTDLALYGYVMQSLASIRQRNLSEHDAMLLSIEAGTKFIIHEIVLRAGQKESVDSDQQQFSIEAMEQEFLNLTQKLWNEIMIAAK